MLRIDGAHGEGGGQILRSALALSVLTGKEMEIFDIRAERARPGLMPQHLKAVEAAAAISSARTEGARLGSKSLFFAPGPVRPGNYRFDIGTAGSAPLVLQTVLLPLALAGSRSRLTIVGGTHVPWSPCYHYLELQYVPWLRQMGLQVTISLSRAGFYPRGGGILEATVMPSSAPPAPLSLTDPGTLRRINVISLVCHLPTTIAERQAESAMTALAHVEGERNVVYLEPPAAGPGTMLLLEALFDGAKVCTFALGARGKPAERVGEEAAEALIRFLQSGATVEEHGGDQLVLPLSLAAGESTFRTSCITSHLETAVWLTRHFLLSGIAIEGKTGSPGTVRVTGSGLEEREHSNDRSETCPKS